MKNTVCLLVMACLLLLFSNSALAQVSVTGPTCVLPGTVYQYQIFGNWDSTSTMQVCITGGSLNDSSGNINCTSTGIPISWIMVIWDGTTNGSLSITSTKGDIVFNVSLTEAFKPGKIDSLDREQIITDTVTIPASIHCSADTGGACTPIYAYQWQKSVDGLIWEDIPGSTDKDLPFNTAIKQQTYFRRQVNETVSNSIAYSDIAFINVIFPSSGL